MVVDGTSDGIWDWNFATQEVYYSPRSLELVTGGRPVHPTIESWKSRLHPEDFDRTVGALSAHLEERRPYDVEFRLRTETRGYRWFRARGQARWDEVGRPTRMVGSIADITEAKVAEQELRLLKEAIDNANDAILITEAEPIDQPGPRVVYCNQAFTRNTGYAPEDIIGKTPRILQGPGTCRKTLDKLRKKLKGWREIRVELLNYKKDGTEFWVELNIRPVADARGWYTHWVSVQRDITERKREEAERRLQADNALRESRERLRAVVTGAPVIVFATGPRRRVHPLRGAGTGGAGAGARRGGGPPRRGSARSRADRRRRRPAGAGGRVGGDDRRGGRPRLRQPALAAPRGGRDGHRRDRRGHRHHGPEARRARDQRPQRPARRPPRTDRGAPAGGHDDPGEPRPEGDLEHPARPGHGAARRPRRGGLPARPPRPDAGRGRLAWPPGGRDRPPGGPARRGGGGPRGPDPVAGPGPRRESPRAADGADRGARRPGADRQLRHPPGGQGAGQGGPGGLAPVAPRRQLGVGRLPRIARRPGRHRHRQRGPLRRVADLQRRDDPGLRRHDRGLVARPRPPRPRDRGAHPPGDRAVRPRGAGPGDRRCRPDQHPPRGLAPRHRQDGHPRRHPPQARGRSTPTNGRSCAATPSTPSSGSRRSPSSARRWRSPTATTRSGTGRATRGA